MTGRADNLRHLFAEAAARGVSATLVRAAADELVALLDQPEPDQRRVATYQRGQAIDRLLGRGLSLAQIRERLGLSVDQVKRARRAVRESRTPSRVP